MVIVFLAIWASISSSLEQSNTKIRAYDRKQKGIIALHNYFI